MADFDAVIIGAGVVGLAIAYEISRTGKSVLIVEKEDGIGRGISSRNSEVIHAGIYYEKGSLKHQFCIKGKNKLYNYLKQYNVPFKNCGKLIVATSESQVSNLNLLKQRGIDNGVNDLEIISEIDAKKLEPSLECTSAIWSPSTGIIDSHGFMASLEANILENGGTIAFNTEFLSSDYNSIIHNIKLNCGEIFEVTADVLINSSGLNSSINGKKSTLCGIEQNLPETYFAKGNYFVFSGNNPFSHLIYPLPEPGGLGVHLTIDLAGHGRFGPDVDWIEEIDFIPNEHRKQKFISEVSKYWPQIIHREIWVDYCGIRPKLSKQNEPAKDFMILGPKDFNNAPIVQLLGIESPGLTSSLAIAEYVNNLLFK